MKLRLELIDDHEGSVSYRIFELKHDREWMLSEDITDVAYDMIASYEKSKEKI